MRTWILGRRSPGPLLKVLGELVGDAGVELDLDLAAAPADGFGLARLEELGRKLAARGLLHQHLVGGRARSSLEDSTVTSPLFSSKVVAVSLKSKRVPVSRRAWSIALVSSAPSNSETTSKENSATLLRSPSTSGRSVEPGHHGGNRKQHPDSEETPRSTAIPAVPSSSGSSGGWNPLSVTSGS